MNNNDLPFSSSFQFTGVIMTSSILVYITNRVFSNKNMSLLRKSGYFSQLLLFVLMNMEPSFLSSMSSDSRRTLSKVCLRHTCHSEKRQRTIEVFKCHLNVRVIIASNASNGVNVNPSGNWSTIWHISFVTPHPTIYSEIVE